MDSSISGLHGDTDLVFERVVGSMGSTLEYGDEDDTDEMGGETSETLSQNSMETEAPRTSVRLQGPSEWGTVLISVMKTYCTVRSK